MKLERKMIASALLNFAITGAEIVGGILSGSLALLSDSLHNFSDAMSILASYIALKIGQRRKNEKFTFGYRRAEILVAFINSSVLVGVSLFLIVEAYRRFLAPKAIDVKVMLPVAAVGLLANIFSVLLLHEHSHESMNVRSAYLHLLSDTLSSMAVVIGGLLMLKYNVSWVDPLITVGIALYILREAYYILKESVEVLMEASPGLDFEEIKRRIEEIPGVKNAHHFHAWRIGEDEVHFECHVSVEDMPISRGQEIIDRIEEILREYGVKHVTVQLEVDRCKNGGIICPTD
ncbi:cobalt transporter [Thermococcus chitonophagus]|uniref:Cobalt transporter n=1 Tax=Thermococcus chitonophagus TaxID=54262 RepID=A0A160VS98_9EURY|nr:cation diffusion facilitator family transporter [Thermococcus chitonophagus]ASJ16562.1 cobalt transporter [Thermococcus chitonophagus]CUX77529.1 Cobalt-zinc-cadmium resistance protein CzcD [Thermococcus chitonophagus]